MHFVVLLSAVVVCAAAVPLNSTEPRIGARINGGSNARDAKYVVSLQLEDGTHVCGGAIIGAVWVVTAETCLKAKITKVRAGSIDNTKGGKIHKVVQEIPYTDEEFGFTFDDIPAVLKVDPPFNSTNGEEAITLDDSGENYTHHIAVVSGWGQLSKGGSGSNILKHLQGTIVSDDICHNAVLLDTTRHICVRYCRGFGTYKGDHGGPLVSVGPERLIGILTNKHGYNNGFQDVYIKINDFHDWINETMVI